MTSHPAVASTRRTGRRRCAGLLGSGLVLLGVVACEPVPPPGPPATAIASGATLASGSQIASPSGRFRLVMQTDGNLVERSPSGRAMWTSKTPNNPGAKLVMRAEGVAAVVSASGATLWSTPTYGVRGARIELADDANVVVRGTAGQPVWANGASGADGTRLPVSQRHTSTHQITLTKIYEGLVSTAPYHNANGNCTVGYGHLIRMGACTSKDKTTKWDADALFADDVAEHERRLASSLGTLQVTQREYDALWDYVFGRGSLTATTSPKMYAALTASPVKYVDVPEILRENGDIQSLRGLCDRRYDQAEVFEGGMYDRSYAC